MKKTTGRSLFLGAMAFALISVTPMELNAQQARELLRVGMTELKSGGRYDHEEAVKLLNAAAKKAGVPWREYWRSAIFGEMGLVATVAPVSSLAMFDGESSLAKMTPVERTKYNTLMSNAVASTRYELIETLPDLSIVSDRKTAPRFARITIVHVVPGKQAEFEDVVKTVLLPALKKAGVKDYWVNRTLLGGPMGTYTTLLIFDKWAELQAFVAPEKLLSPDALKQYMAKVAACVSSAENMVMASDESLGYRAQ